MALIIKSFRQILKQRRGRDYKPRSKEVCYKCGKPGHFIAKCPLSSDSDRGDDKKGRRKEKKKYYKKKGGDAHCWGLVLECYELRTRQHKMLNIKSPSSFKSLFPFGYNEFRTKVMKDVPS
jgi:hypothetical protein